MKTLTLEEQQKILILLHDFVQQYPAVEEMVPTWTSAIDLLISIDTRIENQKQNTDDKVIQFRAR